VIFNKGLDFDTLYTVEFFTRRKQNTSDPEIHPIQTLVERPHALKLHWYNDWTIHMDWVSKASEYEVILEDSEYGGTYSIFITEPFIQLGYWDMPYFAEEGADEAVSGMKSQGMQAEAEAPNALSANITVRAYNADGESILSRESVDVTMFREAIAEN